MTGMTNTIRNKDLGRPGNGGQFAGTTHSEAGGVTLEADKPIMRVLPGGHQEWRLNGRLHCEDGPAYVDSDGTKEWWLDGRRHRVDGECQMNGGTGVA